MVRYTTIQQSYSTCLVHFIRNPYLRQDDCGGQMTSYWAAESNEKQEKSC